MKSVVLNENQISGSQKKFRNIANLPYISNESKSKRHGQCKKITLAHRELNALSKNVAVATGEYQMKLSQKYFKKLEEYVSKQKRIDETTRSMGIEVQNLKSQICRVDGKTNKLKENAVPDYQHGEHIKHARHVVIKLENRLYFARQKENHIKHNNIRFQLLIRNMCIERIQFKKLWVKIVNCLHMNRKMLVAMTDQAVIAFEKGVEYRTRINHATMNASIMKNDQINEISALMRSLRLDRIRIKFVGNKSHRIKMRQLEANEVKRRNESKNYHSKARDAHKMTMDKVQMKSGQSTVDAMITRFEKQKREYVSQFSYMNNLHGHVMQLNAILKNVGKSVREAHVKSMLRKQKSDDRVIRRFDDTLQWLKIENQRKENELIEVNDSVKRHLKELTGLVNTLQCRRIERTSLIKDFENDAVHLHNVPIFLSMIEQRFKEIISFVYYVEWRESDYELPSSKVVQGVDVVNYHLNQETVESIVHECAECAMDAEATGQETQVPLDAATIREELMTKAMTPEMAYRMHNISQCNLPASRSLFAKSLQKYENIIHMKISTVYRYVYFCTEKSQHTFDFLH